MYHVGSGIKKADVKLDILATDQYDGLIEAAQTLPQALLHEHSGTMKWHLEQDLCGRGHSRLYRLTHTSEVLEVPKNSIGTPVRGRVETSLKVMRHDLVVGIHTDN